MRSPSPPSPRRAAPKTRTKTTKAEAVAACTLQPCSDERAMALPHARIMQRPNVPLPVRPRASSSSFSSSAARALHPCAGVGWRAGGARRMHRARACAHDDARTHASRPLPARRGAGHVS
eukprot:scaffold1884_cov215-Prasinococcus_capsulatus_cf.AAC.2